MIKILVGVKRASCCHRCGIWFSFDREDCKVDSDRGVDYLVMNCPNPECGIHLTVG